MTTIQAIADYIVRKCENQGTPITNLRLQQLLYILQKRYLKTANTPAFNNDIEARPFGPCVPEIYYQYCHFGAMSIELTIFGQESSENNCGLNPKLIDCIDKIIQDHVSKEIWDMAKITQKSAYKKAYAQYKHDEKQRLQSYPIIAHRDIRKEF